MPPLWQYFSRLQAVVAQWLEHLGVAAVETLLLSALFLPVDVAEMAWNLEIENKLAKQIESFVG
jgi:hypothetical protein